MNFTSGSRFTLEIHPSNEAMGRAAAEAVARTILALAPSQSTIRVILGSANSQISFITALTRHSLPWEKLVCFHMDEYVGLPATHPASFRRWMKERLADKVPLQKFNYLNGDAPNIEEEISRFSALLREAPIDITCLGIGENGHLAFNDPPCADFDDPEAVKRVTLDEKSRQQQVGEAHFPTIDAVPKEALTITIPVLLSARRIFGIVPEKRKALAVTAALLGPITESCPASILRQTNTCLFLDTESASGLDPATQAKFNHTKAVRP